jgi:hypothetical protein
MRTLSTGENLPNMHAVSAIRFALGCLLIGVGSKPIESVASTSDVKRFQRCYAMFTSTRVAPNDARLLAVKNGSKTAPDACMEVFDLATLGANNRIASIADPVAASVLRKFHEWGRGYTGNKDYFSAFEADHTPELQDPYALANALAYLLFKPNQSFSKIVTDAEGYGAIRDRNSTTDYLLINPYVGKDFRFQVPQSGSNFQNSTPFVPSVQVRQGLLAGIEPLSPLNNLIVNGQSPLPARFPNKNITAHFGGGVLGSQGYILPMFVSGKFNRLPNSVEDQYFKDSMVNGVGHTPRRLAKFILADLLCRELPALRESDVASLASGAYAVSFRKAQSCTACHASIDPLAATYRNLVPLRSLDANAINGFRFFSTRTPELTSAQTDEAIFPPNGDDPNFYRRTPFGQLRFRSYDGTLVFYDVNGLSDLGSKMALTKDLYVCAASKFYRFLTGIQVNLSDLTAPNAAPLSAGALFHRNQVISLGADPVIGLMQHKNLRTLIRRIVESNAFLNPGSAQ